MIRKLVDKSNTHTYDMQDNRFFNFKGDLIFAANLGFLDLVVNKKADYDSLFTKDKQIIFAFHGYPWLIHRLTYRRTNQNLHVRGYKEEGTVTTAFDIRVMNDLDRFHLVQDMINRLPQLGARGDYLKQIVQEKLIQYKLYIEKYGQDMPEVRNWKWSNFNAY